MPKIKPLTDAQIERLAQRQADAIQAPPRTVGSIAVALFVAGVGGVAVAGLLSAILSALGAPGDIILVWSGRAGLLAACLYLAVWALPVSKAQSLRWYAEAQEAVKVAEFRKTEAYRELIALRAAKDTEISELQQALNEAHTDLRNARMELRRAQETIGHAGVRRTFVPKSNTEPQVVRDAQTILRHWFDAGSWYSRPKALASGWSEDRHNAAVRLLDDAALVGKRGNLREVTAAGIDEALRRLADWRESAETAPLPPPAPPVYADAE